PLVSSFRPSNLLNGFGHDITQDITITGNSINSVIDYNYHYEDGGILACKNLFISENKGNLSFERNSSHSSGGALYSVRECWISKNQNYSFISNAASLATTTTSGFGGAIHALDSYITNNLGEGQFLDNVSKNRGGAIYVGVSLSITDNLGPIVIKKNQTLEDSSFGGGIFCRAVNIERNYQNIQINDNASGQGVVYFLP
ncbi:hypothetical protein, partial [Chlamydia pneumoniae]